MSSKRKVLLKIILLLEIIIFSKCSLQFRLFHKINLIKKDKNVFISPISIYNILSLTTNGAKEKTLEELLNLLIDFSKKLKDMNDNDKKLEYLNKKNINIMTKLKESKGVEIANAIFSKLPEIETKFKEITEDYKAGISPLENVDQINNWVDTKTHGKIKKIINELPINVKLILINAIYFKNEWLKKFNKMLTKKEKFYNHNLNTTNNIVEIDMMNIFDKFNYYEDDEAQVISLPYKENNMKAMIILPRKDQDINQYARKLRDSLYYKYLENLETSKVNLKLPKFKINFNMNLNNIFKSMDIKEAFDENNANFQNINKEGGLFISQIIHKTFLSICEDGTEAAAVTAIIMTKNGAIFQTEPLKVYEMNINHPFIFIIYDENLPKLHDILFIGKIEELKE